MLFLPREAGAFCTNSLAKRCRLQLLASPQLIERAEYCLLNMLFYNML